MCRLLPCRRGLPHFGGGSASALTLSRPSQTSLALRPAGSLDHHSSKPTYVGRVLDDGSTQLYIYEYNDFGNVTKSIDPVGRTFSYIYADNGIDLLEARQTRAGQNELLSQMTYNTHHLPLTVRDAGGLTTTYTYNARGQGLTETNAIGDTITYHYDASGFRTSVDGPLGMGDTTTWTYDARGRIQTKTDVSGYTLTFDYDDFDRLTKITYPDGTFDEFMNGSEASNRQFLWCDNDICQERAPGGVVAKRFFAQGMKIEDGSAAGSYFYTRDHLGSIRELSDSTGILRSRYAYDPFGRRAHLEGNLEVEFGFVGMLWDIVANLYFTRFRAYDPDIGRWLSRDPLDLAEFEEGPNLYSYAINNPVNRIDPTGLLTMPLCTYQPRCPGGNDPVPDPNCVHLLVAGFSDCLNLSLGLW
jgi:RHS repeat-associated protein